MPSTHDHPLPGDFIIRNEPANGPRRPAALYVLLEFPLAHGATTSAPVLDVVIEQARALARTRGDGIQIWYEEAGATRRYVKLDT